MLSGGLVDFADVNLALKFAGFAGMENFYKAKHLVENSRTIVISLPFYPTILPVGHVEVSERSVEIVEVACRGNPFCSRRDSNGSGHHYACSACGFMYHSECVGEGHMVEGTCGCDHLGSLIER